MSAARSGGPVILQILPRLGAGGAERGTVDIAAAIVAAGGTALVASAGGPLTAELEQAGAEPVILPLAAKAPWTLRANAGRLVRLIRSHGVDVMHARSRAPGWSALWAARRTGTPFVTTFHAAYNAAGPAKRLYNSVMARGDRVIAISDFIAGHVAGTYGLAPPRLVTIPRGIDLARFDPERVAPERVARLAAAWGVVPGEQVVLMPARLTRWKGQAVLIQALAQLGRPDMRAVLVGADQGRTGYRAELEQLIASQGLAGRVLLADHCDDMPAACLAADIVVHASLEPEGFGRTIVEAAAMGRPVIASDLGAPRETVEPGRTGWLVPAGDPARLARALQEALEQSPAERQAMGRRAAAVARSRYGLERMAAATLAVYAELGGRPWPRA